MGELQYFVDVAGSVDFLRFAEVVGLVGLPYFAKAVEHSCHTRFYKENRMHLTCAPGSIYTHMIDKRV
jgi:hypothetical protein